ncbi:glycoside hydrolase family 38 C-terminal domain-containing protein [Granulicella sp. L60]|uniref:alpha-mannosidase n=1 Tax=Granulicella sp. L60 TaxID=1641866 RepID=UPI00131A6E00|nr:glycoside hydrolase family 38 C-terminal domain-containing protein [Granulicella sp. L60]
MSQEVGSSFRSYVWKAVWLSSVLSSPLLAQPVPSPTGQLSLQSQAVLSRLDDLRILPAGQWKYSSSDAPHAEEINFDDSAWAVAPIQKRLPSETEWFRRTIEVPKNFHGYNLTGSRISFQFKVGADGPVTEIIYLNGRRAAMGEDLESIVLFDDAKPGEKIVVAVKLLPTAGTREISRITLNVEPATNRPNPEQFRKQAASAAELLPLLAPSRFSELDHDLELVDLHALDSGDQTAFDASLNRAQTALQTLQPVLHQMSIDMVGNSHIDAAWLWPWTESVDAVKRTYSTALQLMREYPDYKFTQSAAAYNDWLTEKYPAINDDIKKRVDEGRWELVGGMWVEPDLNLPDGESLVRQLLLGKRFYAKEYGKDIRIGWNPDSFGYNWQLPQIYKRSGVDYFVTQKMHWNDTHQLPFSLFWWQSPDGSKVLTYFPTDYVHTDLDPVRVSRDAVHQAKLAPGLRESMDLYGIGDHGGGPTRMVLDEGEAWSKPGQVAPAMRFTLAQDFFSSVEKKLDQDSPRWNYASIADGYKSPSLPSEGAIHVPTWNDELYFEYHRGIYTTQAGHKRNMRESEVVTLDAERYASFAWLQGKTYPGDDLTEAWKKITFNQFHDLAAGSGIATIYKEAEDDYRQVRRIAGGISTSSLQAVAANINTVVPTGVPVLVFNPLGWQRSGLVEINVQLSSRSPAGVEVLDANNSLQPSQILESDPANHTYKLLVDVHDVPSLGYKLLHVAAGPRHAPTDLHAHNLTLENHNLRVSIDPSNGCIQSIFLKQSSYESLAPGACGNQLQTFIDKPKDYDAWNIDPGTLDHFTTITSVDSVKLIESGALRSTIRIQRTWQSSKFTQDIVLYADSDQVEINNIVDWHETHVLLKAAFPLAASSPNATYEIPFGTIQRPTTRNNSWETARFEVPAQRWADLGDAQHGFSLLNKAKYGYDAAGNVLRLSLLRSTTWPDPNADRGIQRFTYALYPHTGDWKHALTIHRGYELNDPMTAVQVASHTGAMPQSLSFASIQPENVIISAVKKAEDSNALLFRFYEWAGQPATVHLRIPNGSTTATATNLMEKAEAPADLKDGTISLDIKPYEILTVRADYTPAATPTHP